MESPKKLPEALCVGQPRLSPVVVNALAAAPIYIDFRQSQQQSTFHYQPGFEIHLTHEGRARFAIGDRIFHQTPRQGLLFRGQRPHQFKADDSFRFQRTVICFDPERLGIVLPNSALMSLDWLGAGECFPFRLNPGDFTRMDDLCRRLRLEANLQVHGAHEMSVAALIAIIVMIRRNPAAPEPGSRVDSVYRQTGDLVQFASGYVQNHLSDDLSLSAVARIFKVSPEHLTRSFKRQLGVSFHRHVLSERISASKELLRNSLTTSITDVAFGTGFQSSSHFNKVFKAHTGLTPTEFRDQGSDV